VESRSNIAENPQALSQEEILSLREEVSPPKTNNFESYNRYQSSQEFDKIEPVQVGASDLLDLESQQLNVEVTH
jgi:hypothetical protein